MSLRCKIGWHRFSPARPKGIDFGYYRKCSRCERLDRYVGNGQWTESSLNLTDTYSYDGKVIRVIAASLILISLFTFQLSAQTVEVPQKLLDRAAQSFAETAELRKAVDALENEIETRKKLEAAQSELISSLKTEIQALRDQNLALSKIKCDSTTFFFGLIKKKTCR
jgi:hypothetical protein